MNLAFLLLNGSFTILCALIISYYIVKKQITKSIFYYTWTIGFILYGMEIFFRAYDVSNAITQTLLFTAYLFFVSGIWSLFKAKQFLVIFVATLAFLFMSGFLFFSGAISFDILEFVGYTIIFLSVGIAVLQHRIVFGKSAERLATGWILLYFSNILLSGTGWIIDTFAILAKVLILLGILDYDFVIIAEKTLQNKFPAPQAGYGPEGGLKLLLSLDNSSANLRESSWLRKKIIDNVKKNTETIVYVFEDVFPHKEMRAIKWISPEKVSIYLFSSSAKKAKSEFVVLPMGLAQIGAALSQANKQCQTSEKACTVVFMHLSLLIRVFGVEAVYKMLLNKMGYLRENGINLFAVFYPTMHPDPSVVSLFTRLADETIKL